MVGRCGGRARSSGHFYDQNFLNISLMIITKKADFYKDNFFQEIFVMENKLKSWPVLASAHNGVWAGRIGPKHGDDLI